MNRVLQTSVTFGWRQPVRAAADDRVSFVHGAFLMWGFYAWQPYFLELLGRDAVWVTGVVAALVAVVDDRRERARRRRHPLLRQAHDAADRRRRRCSAVATTGVGLVDSFWPAVVLFLLAMGAMGVVTPVQQAYLHAVVPSAERATVVSFGVAGRQRRRDRRIARARLPVAGPVRGDRLRRPAGSRLLFAVPAFVALRAMHEPADVIVGRRAGRRHPAPAQGLPPVSSLDTVARQPESVG